MTETRAALGSLVGTVVHGAGRGRGLGFPTANVDADPGAWVPPPAVYSGWMQRAAGGAIHGATISVGSNPTFCDTPDVHVEVHCHDLSADIYGERVGMWFVARIRDTVKFDSPTALVRAARHDVTLSAELLGTDVGQRILAEVRAASKRP